MIYRVLLLLMLSITIYADATKVIHIDISTDCYYGENNNPFAIKEDINRYLLYIKDKDIMNEYNNAILIVDNHKIELSYSDIDDEIHFFGLIDQVEISMLKNAEHINILLSNDYSSQKYSVEFNPTLDEIENECNQSIENEKKQVIIIRIILFFIIFVLMIFAYKMIKKILNKTKKTISSFNEKLHESKVRRISEDEAIRSTVKKSIDESDDLSELQNLINKAVSKGDNETAKALLEILEKKKKQ